MASYPASPKVLREGFSTIEDCHLTLPGAEGRGAQIGRLLREQSLMDRMVRKRSVERISRRAMSLDREGGDKFEATVLDKTPVASCTTAFAVW